MVVTLITLVYLAWQAYNGYKTGFTRYVVNLIFSAIVFMTAIFFQNPLGNWLYTEFTGEQIQTNLTTEITLMIARFAAFFIILFIGQMIIKVIKSWLPTRDPHSTSLGSILDSVLGAIAAFFAGYFFAYVVLSMLNAIQNPWFMQQTVDSSFLRFIIYDTPGLSNGIFNSIFSISRTAA